MQSDVLRRHRRDVKCKRPPAQDHISPINTVNVPSVPLEVPTGCNSSPTTNGQAVPPGPGEQSIQAEVTWQYPVDDMLQFPNSTSNSIETGIHGQSQWHTGPPLLSGAVGLDEQFPLWVIDPDLHDDILEMNFSPLVNNLISQAEMPDVEFLQTETIQRLWFSHLPETPSHTLYPERVNEDASNIASESASPCPGSTEIDDRYRQDIRKRLQIMFYEPTVPSVSQLNVSIRLYFSKVHAVFPIIHYATFRPKRSNSNLLIAMCATGSLLTGSEQGLRQGIHLFERIHKSTLVNWDRSMAKDQDTMVTIIQCAILAQVFGLLSGSPNLLLTVDAFHGPPIAWARHMRLHRNRPPVCLEPDGNDRNLDEIWRIWARNEELLRVAHALYIVDVELASMLRHEPFQNFESYSFSFASSDRAFSAPNSRDWKGKYLAEMQQRQHHSSSATCGFVLSGNHEIFQVPETSRFTAYALLEGISMEIRRCRTRFGKVAKPLNDFGRPLSDFRDQFLSRPIQYDQDPLQLHILWHAVYMDALADFDLLEKAIGRDGVKLSAEERSIVEDWANSNEGRTCVCHGLMVKKYVQRAQVASELAIHTPRAIFVSAIALFCYIHFGLLNKSLRSLLEICSADNLENFLTGVDRATLLYELKEYGVGDSLPLKMMLFEMIDLLQHAGHWEIARKYAAILTAACTFAFDHGQ